MTGEPFNRIVEMRGAFDRRDPDPAKNYGFHGMDLTFVLKGPRGAVQFVVYTQIHLPHVREELRRRERHEPSEYYDLEKPMGADIGYHSPTPHYEGQSLAAGDEGCAYLDGRPCYYDGSSLQAEEFMPEFIAGGSDAVWRMLEGRYAELFPSEVAS